MNDFQRTGQLKEHFEELTNVMIEYCLQVLKKEEPTGTETILFPKVLEALMQYQLWI